MKKHHLVSLVLPVILTACGGSSSSSGDGSGSNPGGGGVYTPPNSSGIDNQYTPPNNSDYVSKSCVSDAVKNGEANDWFVSLDSVTADGHDEKMAAAEADSAVISLENMEAFEKGMAYILVRGQELLFSFGATFNMSFPVSFCSFEVYADNQCTTDFGPALQVYNVNMNEGVLSYSLLMIDDTDPDTIYDVSLSDAMNHNGSYTQTQGDSVTTSSWSRAENGDEFYTFSSSNGELLTFTEASDCSGTFESITIDDQGIKEHKSSNWDSVLSNFTYKFQLCNDESGVLECISGEY